MTHQPENWAFPYPFEPGEDGEAAHIEFAMPGHTYRASVRTLDSLQAWVDENRNQIRSYTICLPGGLSSHALERITDTILAGFAHKYQTPCGRGWAWALDGIKAWERTTAQAEEDEIAASVAVGDWVPVYRNQAKREGMVMAVEDGGKRCVVEYVMPSGVTYQVEMERFQVGIAASAGRLRFRSAFDRRHPLHNHGRTFGKRTPRWAIDQMKTEEYLHNRAILLESLEW